MPEYWAGQWLIYVQLHRQYMHEFVQTHNRNDLLVAIRAEETAKQILKLLKVT